VTLEKKKKKKEEALGGGKWNNEILGSGILPSKLVDLLGNGDEKDAPELLDSDDKDERRIS